MVEILFLLLPLAFYSGWRAARKHFQKEQTQQCRLSDSYVKGVNFLLSEQPDKALEVFLNYPDIDEYTVETYQLLGNLFRSRGEVDRALRVHQNLIARSNLNPLQKEKAMFALGEDFLAAGMMDRAERVFQELLDNIGQSKEISKASVCRALRNIFEQTQEWQKAIDATLCIESDQKSLLKRTNREDNEDDFIDSSSLITHYYCELADDSLHQGNLLDVENLMTQAKKTNKQSTRLMTLQGDVSFHQQQYKHAFKHYLNAIKTDSRLLSMLSEKLEKSANKTNSIELLQKELLKLYKKTQDKSLFEVILDFAKKYQKNTPSLGQEIDQLIKTELTTRKLNIESIYKATDYIKQDTSQAGTTENTTQISSEEGLALANKGMQNYLQGLPKFTCVHCGYRLHNYLWRCPACQKWDTINHA